jgi:alpha-N-arabinofuranosidase
VEQTKTDYWHENPAGENVQLIEGAATVNDETGEAAIFYINKDQQDDISVELDLRGFEGYKLLEHTEMYTNNLDARNSFENQELLKPRAVAGSKLENGRMSTTAKKLSWNCIRLKRYD